MRIVCISDTHTQVRQVKVPDGDVLIHSGDLTYIGTLQELKKELHALSLLPHKRKFVIAGNHDWLFEKDNSLARSLTDEYGITYLQDEVFTDFPYKVYGSPWVPEFGTWAFMTDRVVGMKEKSDQIPDDTEILITHGPPKSILDLTTDEYHPAENVGCYDLAQRVKELPKLKLHVFGHIHNSYGKLEMGGKMFVNASVCNERYKPINPPVVIDL